MQAETLGQRIHRLRLDKGWSMDELGWHSHVSRNHIWQLEHDKRRHPRPETLEKLAEALGVTPFYLEHGYEQGQANIFGFETLKQALQLTTKLDEQHIQQVLTLIRMMEKESQRAE